MLASADLVSSRREGRQRLWALKPKRLADAHRYLDAIAVQWDGALARPKDHVEED